MPGLRLRAAVSRLCLAVGLPAAFLAVGVPRTAAADESVLTWIAGMDQVFQEQPELQAPGRGWKPFNRIKWFQEQRLVEGRDIPVGARWTAWEQKVARRALTRTDVSVPWFSLGPENMAGRALVIDFDPTDPDILYLGTAGGGLWKSTDAGLTWAPKTDDLPALAVGGVAVLPSDPDVIVIGTGEATYNIDRIGGVGILRSTDGGDTWSTTSLNYSAASGHGFHFIKANPLTDTLLAGATDGLWRSTDGGITWLPAYTGGNFYDAVWKPGSASTVFTVRGSAVVGANEIKKSTNDGLTWATAGIGQPPSDQIGKSKLAISPLLPNTVYAVMVDRVGTQYTGCYRSLDGGTTWTLRSDTPEIANGQGWYNLTLAADPVVPGRLFAGGIHLWSSLDGGGLFTLNGASSHVDHHDIAYRPGSVRLYVVTDGGVWESPDNGLSWEERNAGLVTHQFYDICVNQHAATPEFLMGGTQDQGTDRWEGTTDWYDALGGDGMVCAIDGADGNRVFAELQLGGLRRHANRGIGPWDDITNGITGNARWVAPLAVDPNNADHLYTGTKSGVFRSNDAGDNWTQVSSLNATWISISPVDSRVVWAVGSEIQVTTDDGATWQTSAPVPYSTGTATKILAYPVDVASALVTYSGYDPGLAHVVRTRDFGFTWEDATGDLPSQPVNAIALDPNHPATWFLGTDTGVWMSTSHGASWIPFDTGLPNTVVADLEIQSGTQKLFAGTHGRGAWEVNIAGVTSLDPEDPEPAIPPPAISRNLMLDPPWPNPVERRTTLRYAARSEGEVRLEIHDVRGRRVATVAGAGRGDGIIRSVEWDSRGRAPGVYFAVLRAAGETVTRKLVVAR